MAIEYPDIIGEYIGTTERYEVNGLQYIGTFEPQVLKSGGVINFILFLQNAVNAPLTAELKLSIPQSGRFRGQPLLATKETEISLELDQAEVGRLVIPLTTGEKIVPGNHSLGLEFKVDMPKGGQRIRQSKQVSRVKTPLLDDLVGLDLVGSLGSTFNAQNGRKSSFGFVMSEEPSEEDPVDPNTLSPNYSQIWNLELAESQRRAREDVNEARAKIVDDLKVEPLFASLYAENVERFAEAGQPLRVGEAIAIGKLLTYTAYYFLNQGQLQDGLLCPIWERAIINDLPTANSLDVIRYAGYRHIVRLTAALSFGLVAETVGKHQWSKEERRGVIGFLADSLEDGSFIPPDFIYLPLMLGALRIINKVQLPDEDLNQTLALVQAARQARTSLFTDDDTQIGNDLFERFLKRAMAKVEA